MSVWHATLRAAKELPMGAEAADRTGAYSGREDCFSSEWQSVLCEYNSILADVPILSWGGCMQRQHWHNGSCANYQRRGIWAVDMLETQIVITITFFQISQKCANRYTLNATQLGQTSSVSSKDSSYLAANYQVV